MGRNPTTCGAAVPGVAWERCKEPDTVLFAAELAAQKGRACLVGEQAPGGVPPALEQVKLKPGIWTSP